MTLHELQPLSRRSNGQETGRDAQRLIRRALREWLDKKTFGIPGWPSLIPEWQGVFDLPPFESYRDELLSPCEDAHVAAQLRASLNSQGMLIGAYDLLLAAYALRRGPKIVTHNARQFIRCVRAWVEGSAQPLDS